MIDLAPELLEKIQKDFLKQYNSDGTIKKVLGLVKDNKTTYADANEYSIRVGEMLSNSYKKYLTDDTLPESRLWYNMATTIMQPTLENNYDLIVDVCESAQQTVNTASKVSLGYVQPALNQNKIDGFIDKISNTEVFSDIQWMIGEPVVNFSQAVVDDSIKANANFHAKSGLTPKIVRKLDNAETRTVTRGKSKIRYKVPCEWCKALAGTWNYLDMPDFIADNIFRRHENCRCTVEYVGDGKKQDVWSKKYIQEQEQAKEERIARQKKRLTKDERIESIRNTLYQDIGFSAVNPNLKTANVDILELTVDKLKELEDRFNIIHRSINPTINQESKRGAIAFVRRNRNNSAFQSLSIGAEYKKKLDTFIETQKYAITSGWSMPILATDNNYVVYPIVHEYGHMIENLLISLERPQSFDHYALQYYKEIIGIAKANNPSFVLFDNLSEYGRTNYAEFFAEVFANSQLGAPNELGLAMQEWLKKKGL